MEKGHEKRKREKEKKREKDNREMKTFEKVQA
jgi:hypothetical protein